jgi:hypothetical protein
MNAPVILSAAKNLPAECGAAREKILRCAQDDRNTVTG